ncbi:CDP-glycerol glycerophosphotransferase family protein [Vibrio sp. 506]|uniref:CDP-glycerol glycerophosphotransferase family protein n=1 Tax=Vibrio sp. 506 TaxID=3074607 RepID=UPI0029642012|nr:CDP-glycerol glycerophosphotransferase family protein [Vibrio sp. 506]MDW2056802.1 CDP-glycerol glycerophosphotransferase family protein [Vibrio sp. 506]
MKRNKQIWVFGAWFGQRYSDNCRSLYEYVNNNHNQIRCVWLARDEKTINEIRNSGFEAEKIWSIKGIWLSLKAGNVVFSSGLKDINQYFINGAITYNLWHGAPLKKIGESNKFTKSIADSFVYNKIFPFLNGLKFDYLLSTSYYFNDFLSEAFCKEKNQIVTIGYPRNDVLINNSNGGKSEGFSRYQKIIFYMPTFRDSRPKYDFFNGFNADKFNTYLIDNNILFVYKLHFMSPSVKISKSNIVDYDSLDVDFDLYEFLTDVDVLITDYSSVYFDYLLTGNQVILTPFDLQEYNKQDREFYFDYDELFCDAKCKDWNEVYKIITSQMKSDVTPSCRLKAMRKFNKNIEGNSSQKLAEEIMAK